MTQLHDDHEFEASEVASEEAAAPSEPAPVAASTGAADPEAVLREAGEGELEGATFTRVAQAAFADADSFRHLKRLLDDWKSLSPGDATRSKVLEGYARYLVGDLEGARERLKATASQEPWAAYYHVRALLASHRPAEAFEAARGAAKSFSDSVDLEYLLAETASRAGELEVAEEALGKLEGRGLADSSPFLYHRGYFLERSSEYPAAIDCYRKAIEVDETNTQAAFRLGFCLDLYGSGDEKDLDEAIHAYEKCLKVVPPHVNAVINLGILYEDRERYHDAIKCFESVLRIYPNHSRARLFLDDARASTEMFYDKEEEKKADRHNQVLKIPVTDFELSVRSRNCLSKMNILTLGDLIMKSEQELLSYKNFGETSLKEIKDMLTQKGLRLGQGLESTGAPKADDPRNPLEATANPELLDKSIDFLDLSVRSRRCMERLGIQTLRDLINKTEVQLMAAKNFGMTSLNEIKRKLTENNLKLRGS